MNSSKKEDDLLFLVDDNLDSDYLEVTGVTSWVKMTSWDHSDGK